MLRAFGAFGIWPLAAMTVAGGGRAADMTTKLFDTAQTYSTPGTVAIALVAKQMHTIDLAACAPAGSLVCTFPNGIEVGEALGLALSTDDAIGVVTLAGPVSALALPMATAGDAQLFTWDGTTWVCVASTLAPGWLEALGSAVGLYRLQSPTNFATDFSGNARTLAASGTVTASPGIAPSRGSAKSSASIGQQASAAFQLQAAMSLICLVNVRLSAQSNQNFVSCGIAGASAPTNLQWALGTSATGTWQYFHENGAGVDVVYSPASVSSLGVGWQVMGFTRSAGGVVRFYGNGVLLSTSGALAAPTGGGSSQLSVGAFQGGTFPCNADIAQVGVYSAELTAAQMLRQSRILLGAA